MFCQPLLFGCMSSTIKSAYLPKPNYDSDWLKIRGAVHTPQWADFNGGTEQPLARTFKKTFGTP